MEVNILAFVDIALFILVLTGFLLICKNSQLK